ncbi:MAG: Tex family protein [Spirochaetes bacterium]|nr:Tex family protein [Spirochaetota bacterium]
MDLNEEFVGGLSINEVAILNRIAGELTIKANQASAVVTLVGEGCTIPFISRYRKERTGSLDEVQVRDVAHLYSSYKNLEERRIEVVKGIFAQGKLTEALYGFIRKAAMLAEIEDIYAPFKKKKKTRGMIAQEKGLEPLAELILAGDDTAVDAAAPGFIRTDAEHPELSVASAREAIEGAKDIVAERTAQSPDNRATVKDFYRKDGHIVVKGVGDGEKKSKSVYQMYWDYREPLSQLKPHRVMAVNRGEREGELEVTLDVDQETAILMLRNKADTRGAYHAEAVEDGLIRLLSPAVLREIRSDAGENADGHAIGVFSENLRNLLMQPPIKGTRVLGIDPGIRTGTKCAALDETGKFLDYFVINQELKPEMAKEAIVKAVRKHDIRLIAVGNGTASHEVQEVVAAAIADNSLAAEYTVVDEDGASVYSASDVAREEFPELDLTIRGAISIGRRLQDPLAELVKIDPQSIGVGMYQHDVNQKRLSDTLDEVVGSVVNNVGVNLNTASQSLLRYVSGINSGLARKIVKFREENGRIDSRGKLMEIPGMGAKTFEQCAGFLKIPESVNPLDNTWVHPEHYGLAEEILTIVRSGGDVRKDVRDSIRTKYGVGDSTLDDIVNEIRKPNRDPRENFPPPVLQKGVIRFEDLSEGMTVKGKVKNVVDFGAFVDIGIKENALIHVSEMSDRYIKDPMEALKVGEVKDFRIISLDVVRKRIGLSLKSERGVSRPGSSEGRRDAEEGGRPLDGAKRVVVEGKPGTGDANTAESRREAPRREGRRSRSGNATHGDRPDRDDDGTTYNPFAELLKKR